MGDTYMNTKSAGDYGTDTPDQSAQSSQLYKALLQQSMQQPQGSGLGGIFAKMLGTFGASKADSGNCLVIRRPNSATSAQVLAVETTNGR